MVFHTPSANEHKRRAGGGVNNRATSRGADRKGTNLSEPRDESARVSNATARLACLGGFLQCLSAQCAGQGQPDELDVLQPVTRKRSVAKQHRVRALRVGPRETTHLRVKDGPGLFQEPAVKERVRNVGSLTTA